MKDNSFVENRFIRETRFVSVKKLVHITCIYHSRRQKKGELEVDWLDNIKQSIRTCEIKNRLESTLQLNIKWESCLQHCISCLRARICVKRKMRQSITANNNIKTIIKT